jgi:hypothetical protein
MLVKSVSVLKLYFICMQTVSDGVVGKAPNYLLSDTVAMLADWCSKVTSLPECFEDWSVQQYQGNILYCSHVYKYTLTNLLPQLLALNFTFVF